MIASNKTNRRKTKIKGFRSQELLEEQPFWNNPIEKPESRNFSIKELLDEQSFHNALIKKPKSRNISIEELLSEQPFYKLSIKEPKNKRKKLSNLELLQVLPFYDDVGIFKRQRAYQKCLGCYDVQCIVKNSLNDSLFSSKKSIKSLFKDLLREKEGFKN